MELNAIKEIIATQLQMDVENITEETSFKEIEMDSLDMVEIVMEIEERFNISINEAQEENLKTVGDLIALIKG